MTIAIRPNNQSLTINNYHPLHMKHIPILSLLFFCFFFLQNEVNAQCISGNCKDGTGIYMYPSGAKYIGQFKDGEIHGVGTCYYSDGSVYRGEWAHRYPQGNGIKTLQDGRSWEGEWKMGLPVNEEGVVIEDLFPDPEPVIQSGCLEGNCEDGKGLYAYPDGSKYEGEFQNSKPDGEGILTYASGDYYRGYFKNGLKEGKGTLHYADNTQSSGEWRKGEYIGNSLIEDGKVGCTDGDCKNGYGTYVYKDGAAKYTGSFSNNMPDGNGTIYYANGERYKGEWALGSFNGEGILYLPDGTEVVGYWKDGSYMGREDPRLHEEPESPSMTPDEFIAVRKANDMKVLGGDCRYLFLQPHAGIEIHRR